MNKAVFLVMTKKGCYSLENFIAKFGAERIGYVVSHPDKHVQEDYFDEIAGLCRKHNIKFFDKNDNYSLEGFCVFVIGWRWLVSSAEKFYIFHDSLLPRYRGFAPVVSQLLNKESRIGVSCIYSDNEYDKGDIVGQEKIEISYPIKIAEAIDKLCPLYSSLLNEVYSKLSGSIELNGKKQDDSLASYSIWRDDDDYIIDWNKDSDFIKRFIDSVGYPYLGALTKAGAKIIRVLESELYPECTIENRDPGKVMFIKNDCPVVICGKGLLKITKAVYDDTGENFLPLHKFRIRFE